MIKSRLLPMDKILSQLDKSDRIAIIACNDCARVSGVGGREKAEEMEEKLRNEGYNVVSICDLVVACNDAYFADANINPAADTIIMLSCASGERLARRLFKDKKVVTATELISGIIVSPSTGRYKLVGPFTGKEDFEGKEYKYYTDTAFKDTKL
jgi:hypothetical protein